MRRRILASLSIITLGIGLVMMIPPQRAAAHEECSILTCTGYTTVDTYVEQGCYLNGNSCNCPLQGAPGIQYLTDNECPNGDQ